MPVGPGKYDVECSAARESAGAIAAIVVIIGGNRGSGFSVQAVNDVAMQSTLDRLPAVLFDIANEIKASRP